MPSPPTRARRVLPCALAAALLAAAFAPVAAAQVIESVPLVPPFSAQDPGAAPRHGWEVIRLSSRKPLTSYDFVAEDTGVVLRARAEASSGVLAHATAFDVHAAPVVSWRWKVDQLIPNADNRIAARDDSPVRLVFAFEGNKSRLPLTDQAIFLLARMGGRELPYATLMYVWSNDLPVGTVIPNPHTRRVQMVVAASGPRDTGSWASLRRNLLEDFRRAFGEDPGQLYAVGVMTDTDNTGTFVEARYGDIRFSLP